MLFRSKWACHVNNKQVSQGCQEGQGSVWFPQSSEIRGFCKSKAGLLEAFGAPFSVYIRELSSGQGPHSLWCQRWKVWECHRRLLLPVPSGTTSGFRLLGNKLPSQILFPGYIREYASPNNNQIHIKSNAPKQVKLSSISLFEHLF